MNDSKNSDFTALQTLTKRTAFKLINMDFAKEDARKLQKTGFTIFIRTGRGTKLQVQVKVRTTQQN